MRTTNPIFVALSLLVSAGCAQLTSERNPFLTLTETLGVSALGETDTGTGTGTLAEGEFRRSMTVTLANNHPNATLDTSFLAWVNISSIRSAEQQDALLADGYVQLSRTVDIGSAYSLPPGTFVYNGPATAGATPVELGAASGSGEEFTPSTTAFQLITPDVVLVFLQPPVSCDSVAFTYSRNGDVITADPVAGGAAGPYGGANTFGGYKTLAQVDAYQCEPLAPGLFLKLGGGAREDNEFFEGENVRFDFFANPDDAGSFAITTISSNT